MTTGSETTLLEARRAFDAAELLFRDGFIAECHRFMLEALRGSLSAWQKQPSPPDEAEALAALDTAGYGDLEQLRAALAVTPAQLPTDFEWIWAEAERLYDFSLKKLAPDRKRKRLRLGLGALIVLVVLTALVLTLRLWGRPRARASGVIGPDFEAEKVIDGLDATEWLPPDGQTAWLELRLPSPRQVRRVRVYNGHNRFYVDRGTERFVVTLFAHEQQVAKAEARFAKMTDDIVSVDVAVEGKDVTLVRIDVLSAFGRGPAIGEVELE